MREQRGWRSTTDEGRASIQKKRRKQPVGQISVHPLAQKYSAFAVGQITDLTLRVPPHNRGVSRSSRTRGADAVDAAASGAQRDAGRV